MKYIVEEQTYEEFFNDLVRPYLDNDVELITYLKIDSDLMRDIHTLNISKNRIFVIFDLDEKFKEQNMLLKLLEDEKENHFVLVVKNKENLLPTVRNRCIYYTNTRPRKIVVNEYVKELVDKVVHKLDLATNANLFTLVKKVEEIDCKEPIIQFLDLLNLEWGTDPIINRDKLKLVGKAQVRIKRVPIMSRQVFTVLLLDLKELK